MGSPTLLRMCDPQGLVGEPEDQEGSSVQKTWRSGRRPTFGDHVDHAPYSEQK